MRPICKFIGTTIVTIIVLSMLFSPAYSETSYREAKEIVKSLPCKNGGTVDQFLTKKASVPAVEDLGWKAYPLKNGGFEIERILILSKTKPMKYRWTVTTSGVATPSNGKAIGITK